MGVMACSRRGCRNILCDKLILDYEKYICHECYDELLAAKRRICKKAKSEYDVRPLIESFLNDRESVTLPKPLDVEIEETFNRLVKVTQ